MLHMAVILSVGCVLLLSDSYADTLSPVDVFSKPSEIRAVLLSPNGSQAAILGLYDGKAVLMVSDVSSGNSRIVADLTKMTNVLPMFISDDELLLLRVNVVQSHGGPAYPRYFAPLLLDISDATVRPLFRPSRKFETWRGSRQPFLGHSDDRAQAYVRAYRAPLRPHSSRRYPVVAAVDLATKHPRIVSAINPSANVVFIDANGLPVASIERNKSEHENRIWSYDDGNEVLIYDEDDDAPKVFVFGLTPTRDALVVKSESDSGDWQCCYTLNLSDGSVSGPLFQREGRFIEWLQVDPNGIVIGVRFAGFYPEYEFQDEELTRRVQRIQALYPDSAVHLVSLTPDHETAVMFVTGAQSSGVYLKFSGESPEPTLLARATPAITANYLTRSQVVDFKASDGVSLQALLTVRDDVRKAGSAPLIVIPDNLSRSHVQVGFDWQVQYFAYRGYAVLQQQARYPDSDFNANDVEQFIGRLWRDVDDGVQSLVHAGIVDSEKVCLVGDKVGGYTALSAGAFSSFRYRCIVSIDGISDLSLLYREVLRQDDTASTLIERLIGPFGKGRRRLKAISPLNNIDSFDSAVLLIHGEDSPFASVELSRRMYSRLLINGNDVHLVRVEDEDGTWSQFDNRRQALRSIDQFIRLHIGSSERAQE